MTPAIYLLTVNLLLAVLTLSYGLLLRRSGWFSVNRLLLWLMVGLAGWLPLTDLPEVRPDYLRSLVQRAETLFPTHFSRRAPGVSPADAPAHPTPPIRLAAPPSTAQSLWYGPWLGWLYGLGVVVLTLRFGGQLVALHRLIRGSERRRFRGGVWLIENASVCAPFSFFRYIVLNPARYMPAELDQILWHEELHCRQRHSLDRLASEGLRIIFWINPLVWWHGRLVQENLEYQADRAVLKTGVDVRDYQYNLLAVSLLNQPVGFVNSFGGRQLTNRILMMRRRPVGAGLLATGVFGLLVGLVLLIWPTAQRTLLDKPLSRFAVARGNQTFFVIVPTADASDLKTIQEIARQRTITIEVAPVVLRDRQHRIQQISFGVRPALPAHAPWTSLKAGTPYGQQPISPLGIRCDPAACTVTPVDQTFPVGLRELARQESVSPTPGNPAAMPDLTSKANLQYGLYETYFLDDMIESSFYGLRAMLLRIRPDKRLDLYDEARNAVIIWDRHEISRTDLQRIRVTEVMKLSVYKGDAAVARLGHERARPGLVVLSRHPNPAQAEDYAANRHLY